MLRLRGAWLLAAGFPNGTRVMVTVEAGRLVLNQVQALAVEFHLGARVNYAQVVKEFGSEGGEVARRYAPPRLIGQEKIKVSGEPDEDRACTSHVERTNWTLRGHLRRFARLSNGFSRKKANLRAALALYFAYYNFCRMHKSIRMTPAMKAGIARQPWSLADLLTAAMAAA